MDSANDKCFLKDFSFPRPVHYDCVVCDVVLPWNNQTIQCYIDYGPVKLYYPTLPEGIDYPGQTFLPEEVDARGYFTKEEYEDYCERCRTKSEQQKIEQKDAYNRTAYVYLNLRKANEAMADKCVYYKRFIHYGLYELSCFNSEMQITKYKDADLDRRWHWNEDKSFPVMKVDIESAHEVFLDIISKEQ